MFLKEGVSSNFVFLSASNNFFCSLDSLDGISTFKITYISPFLELLGTSKPFPFKRCLSPVLLPAGIVYLTVPIRVGTSTLAPNTASVIVIGSVKYISSSSLSNKG